MRDAHRQHLVAVVKMCNEMVHALFLREKGTILVVIAHDLHQQGKKLLTQVLPGIQLGVL